MSSDTPRTAAGRRLFTDMDPMDMMESNGVTPADIRAIEDEAREQALAEAEVAIGGNRGYPGESDDKDGGRIWWSSDPIGHYVQWSSVLAALAALRKPVQPTAVLTLSDQHPGLRSGDLHHGLRVEEPFDDPD